MSFAAFQLPPTSPLQASHSMSATLPLLLATRPWPAGQFFQGWQTLPWLARVAALE